jgi:hypothetical protein
MKTKIIAIMILFLWGMGVQGSLFCSNKAGTCWLRYNQAGYMPDMPKRVVVMSEREIKGTAWRIFGPGGKTAASGKLGTSVCGKTGHTPKPFNYVIDFSGIKTIGAYRLELGKPVLTAPVSLRIDRSPYAFIIPDAIRYLRVHRSGTEDTAFHKASHFGDARAILHRPKDGKWQSGLWEKAPGAKTVDMQGGWYDAADYIKFTLTTANTTYFLLRAYEVNPSLFSKKYSRSSLVDILDEATIGLDYLVKAYPSKDIFIIQVSGKDDHESGWRLPENDTREGKREAFSAISPPHMGMASAALALGARVFAGLDSPVYQKLAARYTKAAIAIFERARQPDALESGAFEFNPNGGFSFYRDKTPVDNMILGATELFELTGNKEYLEIAKSYGNPTGKEVHWASLFLYANTRLGRYDKKALQAARNEAAIYTGKAKSNIWGIPGRYSWGSLANWCTTVSGLGLLNRGQETKDENITRAMAYIIDYTFGANNWGVSFFFTKKLPNSVKNIYSQIFRIQKVFPEGALSEGPAGRVTHDRNLKWFNFKPETQWTYPFNTEEAVFYDDATDFVTQESTIFGQAGVLLFLTLLSSM